MQLPPLDAERTILSPEAIAATYSTPGQIAAWDAVEQYRRVQRVASRNPNAGSVALASKLELPRGRIRPWLDGSAPDVVRGLVTAHEHRWFDTDRIPAWTTLVAGILGGGSIAAETYSPEWTTTPTAAVERIQDALDELDVGHQEVCRENRPDSIRPAEDQSVLGRALVALGAPAGNKNTDSEPLPEWLLTTPIQARLVAVEVLVLYRGQAFEEKDTVELFETRSRAFRESVADLIGSVVDGEVNAGSRYVIISAAAAHELGVDREGMLRDAIDSPG